jgi:predicted MFS family arabinose efflux permease
VEGNARLSATESVAELGGPALAGLLFQWLTAPVAIAVNAVTYLVSALVLATIRKPEPAPDPTSADPEAALHWTADLTQGFRAAWAEPRVRPLLVMAASNGLFGGVFSALYLIFCLRVVGLNPAQMGLAIACGGAGAFIGSALAQPLAKALGVGRAIPTAALAMAAFALLIPAAPAKPWIGLLVIMASQVLCDLTGVIAEILSASLRQSVLPPQVLGRTAGAFQAARGGTMLVGALAGGVLGQVLGVREMMWITASGLALGPLIAGGSRALRAVEAIVPEA